MAELLPVGNRRSTWNRTLDFLSCSSCRGKKVHPDEPLWSGDQITESVGKPAAAVIIERGEVGDLGLVHLEEVVLDRIDCAKESEEAVEDWAVKNTSEGIFDSLKLEIQEVTEEGEIEQGFPIIEFDPSSLPTANMELSLQEVEAISVLSEEEQLVEDGDDLTDDPCSENPARAEDRVGDDDIFATENVALNGMDIPHRYFHGTGEANHDDVHDDVYHDTEGDLAAASMDDDERPVQEILQEVLSERELIAKRVEVINDLLARDFHDEQPLDESLLEALAADLPTPAIPFGIHVEESSVNNLPAETLELTMTLLSQEALEVAENVALEILNSSAEDNADAFASDLPNPEAIQKVAEETVEVPLETQAEEHVTEVTAESLEVATPQETLEEVEDAALDILADKHDEGYLEGVTAAFSNNSLVQECLAEAAKVAKEASAQAARVTAANAMPAPHVVWRIASGKLRPSQAFSQEVAEKIIDPVLFQVVRTLEQERPLASTSSSVDRGSPPPAVLSFTLSALDLDRTLSSTNSPGLKAASAVADLRITAASLADLSPAVSSLDLYPSVKSTDIPSLGGSASVFELGTTTSFPVRGSTMSLMDLRAAETGPREASRRLPNPAECGAAAEGEAAASGGDIAPSTSNSEEWPDQGKEQHRTTRNNNKRNKKRNKRPRK